MAQYINKVAYGLSQPLITEAPLPINANRQPTTADTAYLVGQLWIYPAAQSAYILVLVANNSAVWQLLESSGGAGVFSSLVVVGPTTLEGTVLINNTGAGVTTIGTGGTGAVNIGNATGNTAVTGTLTASLGLIASAGGINATGTSNINTTGAAVTSINTGGTGALHLGNATGNTAVTGSLTASTGLIATTGGINATGTSNINTTGAGVTSINTGGTGALNLGNATGNTAVTGSLTASTSLTATSGNVTATNGNFVLSTAATMLVLPGPVNIMTGAGAPSAGLAVNIGDMYIQTDAASAVTRLYIATAASTWTNVTCAA